MTEVGKQQDFVFPSMYDDNAKLDYMLKEKRKEQERKKLSGGQSGAVEMGDGSEQSGLESESEESDAESEESDGESEESDAESEPFTRFFDSSLQ